MILAVTGITGHTGRFFLKELENHQFDGVLRCLVRESSNTMPLDKSPLRIEKIIGDNTDYEAFLALTKNADVVMHIYNIRHSVSLLKAAMENHVPRVVMVHTTGVYSKYKMASEEYQQIEDAVDVLLQTGDTDVTILRPTMIFGDLCDRNIHKFIAMVDRLPLMPEINRGKGRIRPVNARDLAKAFYTVCMTSGLPERRYDLSGERSLTLHELFDLIGHFLGKRVHHISLPLCFASLGAKGLRALSGGRIDYIERVLRMGEDRDYGHEAASRDFGYTPEPFHVGLQREVMQYMHRKKES